MKSGTDTYNCGWDTFVKMSEKMGQPLVPGDSSRIPHGLTERVHFFFIDEKDVQAYEKLPEYRARAASMRARSGVDGDVMILDSSHTNRWDATPVVGIMSISQLIVMKRNPDQRLLLTEAIDIINSCDE
jgi:hypothetical protein